MEDLLKGLQELKEAQEAANTASASEIAKLQAEVQDLRTVNAKLYKDEVKHELLNAGFEAALSRAQKGLVGKFDWNLDELKATKSFGKVSKAVSTSDTAAFQQTALNQITRDIIEESWLARIPRFDVTGPSLQVPKLPNVSGVVLIAENTNDSAQAVAASTATLASTVLDPETLGVRTAISRNGVEKSYMDLVPVIGDASIRALRDAVQSVIINGDTAASLDSGGGAYASDDARKAWDGLRKLGIASNKSDLSTYTQAKLFALIDGMGLYSQWPLIGLVRGAAWGTIAGGMTGNVELWSRLAGERSLANYAGADWYKTALIPATDANGVVAGSGNSYNEVVLFAPEAYALGFGRDFGIEVEYSAMMQCYHVIVTVDVDFQKTVATAGVPAAVAYKMA